MVRLYNVKTRLGKRTFVEWNGPDVPSELSASQGTGLAKLNADGRKDTITLCLVEAIAGGTAEFEHASFPAEVFPQSANPIASAINQMFIVFDNLIAFV
jgi:hypothetical protein